MKTKFPRRLACEVARELVAILEPVCERLIVAGSLRRMKAEVGDVEIVYIPKTEVRQVPGDMFARGPVNLADEAIAQAEISSILEKRLSVTGSPAFGPKNKLMIHTRTGVPVDLFATTAEAWFNYLVCRTGSAENNTRLATAAQRCGFTWHPYRSGFTDLSTGRSIIVKSEEDVFRIVGLPYLEPKDR
jgi:DNA polymerase/3'-5' exonuclease PolX